MAETAQTRSRGTVNAPRGNMTAASSSFKRPEAETTRTQTRGAPSENSEPSHRDTRTFPSRGGLPGFSFFAVSHNNKKWRMSRSVINHRQATHILLQLVCAWDWEEPVWRGKHLDDVTRTFPVSFQNKRFWRSFSYLMRIKSAGGFINNTNTMF